MEQRRRLRLGCGYDMAMDMTRENPYRATREQRPAESLKITILRLSVPVLAAEAAILLFELLAITLFAAHVGLHCGSFRQFLQALDKPGGAILLGSVVVTLLLRRWVIRHLRKLDDSSATQSGRL
jgi:hypothetical protein